MNDSDLLTAIGKTLYSGDSSNPSVIFFFEKIMDRAIHNDVASEDYHQMHKFLLKIGRMIDGFRNGPSTWKQEAENFISLTGKLGNRISLKDGRSGTLKGFNPLLDVWILENEDGEIQFSENYDL